MKQFKSQYEKPQLTNQGSIVNETRATSCGQCWDGSPNTNDDTRHCNAEFEIQ